MTAEDPQIDAKLMRAVAAGDEAAFRQLVERHQRAVYGTIVKMLGDPIEAEDLAQQVFLRVYRAADRYEARAQFRTWLFTIVRRLVFNEHRRRGRAWLQPIITEADRSDDQPHAPELADSTVKHPDRDLLDREMMQAVDRAILALPEQQRLAVLLRRYDELPYDEIASVLKTSVSATKSLLFRARETLRKELQAYMGGDTNS